MFCRKFLKIRSGYQKGKNYLQVWPSGTIGYHRVPFGTILVCRVRFGKGSAGFNSPRRLIQTDWLTKPGLEMLMHLKISMRSKLEEKYAITIFWDTLKIFFFKVDDNFVLLNAFPTHHITIKSTPTYQISVINPYLSWRDVFASLPLPPFHKK